MNGSRAKRQRTGDAEVCTNTRGLKWVLGDQVNEEDFLENYWEKKPLLIQRNKPDHYDGLFTRKTLLELSRENDFVCGVDLNVVACPDGLVKQVVHTEGEQATARYLDSVCSKEGYTVQFFQPQRYVDKLWEHMAELEAGFSSLWGANVYITPPKTQGLAPHYDDVDVFILQTEGCKRWKIHGPGNPNQVLAMEYSEDLDEENIGPLVMDIVLKPGDLLYLPRGTIHHAKAEEGEDHSVHITLSTYQSHTYYNLLEATFQKLLDACASTDEDFRKGLPVGYLQRSGTWRASRTSPGDAAKKTADLLRKIADKIVDGGNVDQEGSALEAFHEGVDEFAVDFMRSRLPPFGKQIESSDGAVESSSSIRLVSPNLLHVTLELEADTGDDSKSEDSSESDGVLRVFLCSKNNRKTHMGPQQAPELGEAEDGSFDIDVKSKPILRVLLENYPQPTKVADLPEKELAESIVEKLITNGVCIVT
mmetsp:Transcript_11005/g.20358  ORF Transcript_11005/g.20358 Transcript_11005/m.20358 type:complete len:477 (+) Transcript_11005:1476-2906(+)